MTPLLSRQAFQVGRQAVAGLIAIVCAGHLCARSLINPGQPVSRAMDDSGNERDRECAVRVRLEGVAQAGPAGYVADLANASAWPAPVDQAVASILLAVIAAVWTTKRFRIHSSFLLL